MPFFFSLNKMVYKDILWKVVALFCISQVLADGPICYQCDDVPAIKDCSQTIMCGEHEKCATHLYIASNLRQYYQLGCIDANVCSKNQESLFGFGFMGLASSPSMVGKRSLPHSLEPDVISRKSRASEDMLLCLECAASNLTVQVNQCGSPPTTNLRCFSSDDVLRPRDSDRIIECSQDELCFAHKTPIEVDKGTFRYQLGCQSKQVCRAFSAPTAHLSIGCVKCCDHSYCNLAVCTENGTEWTGETTTIAQTTPAAVTGNGPLTVTIEGNRTGEYLKPLSLRCVANKPTTRLVWNHNGRSDIYPDGVTVNGDTLNIASLNITNLGPYECTLISGQSFGKANATLQIKVEAAKVIHVSHSLDSNAHVLSFGCEYVGFPPPTITWTFHQVSGSEKHPGACFIMIKVFG
ncbi:uncharacterized protein LOC128221309 isoform X2 [Mya arenaria]|uniref:uncharacterized protein LOC128221309 isoform X2 n=1 Tax=Mya arenaria TaxID=6604 RepID=UPI0022E29796|nr:uncharacterized protein LOC128221309 isoform X2 [Mya arenaria]